MNSSNWGGLTGVNNVSSLSSEEDEEPQYREYAPNNSVADNEDEDEYEREEIERKETIDTTKWSSDVFERHKSHFKQISFYIMFGKIRHRARMMIAIPGDPANTITMNSTIALPINGDAVDVGKIFTQKRKDVFTEMKNFVDNNKTVTRTAHKNTNEPEHAVMIQSITCLEVGSKIDDGRPIGIKINGIQNAFVVDHAVSWNKDPYTAVVSTKTQNRILYKSGSTAQPLMEAIHGSDKNFQMIGRNNAYWGNVVDRCYNVQIMSGYAVWLFYHMFELMKAYKDNQPDKKTLPPKLRPEVYQLLEKADHEWKKRNRERRLPSNIYLPECDLTDGYMGHVISTISKGHESRRASDPAWTLDTDQPIMRIPEEFIKFVSEKLQQVVQGVVMTSTDNISVQAECKKIDSDTIVNKDTPMYLTVQMVVFYPVTFYLITPDAETSN